MRLLASTSAAPGSGVRPSIPIRLRGEVRLRERLADSPYFNVHGKIDIVHVSFLTVAVVAAVASCGDGLPSMAELKARPESGLHPPDARFISHNEHDAEQTIDGPLVAIVGDIFAIDADADSIFTFYDMELSKLGYVRDDRDLSNVKTTEEEAVRVWRNGDVVARVAIFRIPDAQAPPLPPDMPDGSVFELALIAKPQEAYSGSS